MASHLTVKTSRVSFFTWCRDGTYSNEKGTSAFLEEAVNKFLNTY